MANPEVHQIHDLLGPIYKNADVLSAPLVLAKDTLIHVSLAPAVERIADDPNRRAKAVAALPPLARRLLDDLERTGSVRMDRWSASSKKARAARLRLERGLLVTSREFHTESGYHTSVVMLWSQSKIATQFSAKARRLPYEDAVDEVVLAAVRSAVLAPEREVRNWFVFGQDRFDELLRKGHLARLKAGKIVWITLRTAAPVRTSLRRAGRGR